MQFLRTFGLLLLLVMGNTGNAFSYSVSLPYPEKDQVEFHFSEVRQNLSVSILNTPAEVMINRTFTSVVLVPEQLCPRKISKAGRYLVFSRTIDPSLDVADIIFPFHSFL